MTCTASSAFQSTAYVRVDREHLGAGVLASEHQPGTSHATGALLIIDVSAVQTVDSSGLGALVSIYRRAAPAACILLGAAGQLAAAISRAKLTDLFEVASDADAVEQIVRLRDALEGGDTGSGRTPRIVGPAKPANASVDRQPAAISA